MEEIEQLKKELEHYRTEYIKSSQKNLDLERKCGILERQVKYYKEMLDKLLHKYLQNEQYLSLDDL